jgi:hypothetical protein
MSRRATLVVLVLLAALAGVAPAAADFRDGPVFADTAANGRLDVGDLYVFRSPANANDTVFAMTVSPFAGNVTSSAFVKGARYDIAIDKSGDFVSDMVLRTTFGAASAADGTQRLLVRCLPKPRCRRYVLARDTTGTNIPLRGGGQLRAAVQDNPAFFDLAAWDDLVQDGVGVFPRAPANARNFWGTNGNALAIVLELPSARIAPNGNVIAVWARTISGGGQVDREGRPFVNVGMIPPLPRDARLAERRTAFNVGRPEHDLAAFAADMRSLLQTFWRRTAGDADALTALFLPDVELFQVGNPNGFGVFVSDGGGHFPATAFGAVLGNGRRLGDDVDDTMLTAISNLALTTDNVRDDNGLRLTDGSVDPVSGLTRAIAFPYVGAANLPLNGPGTGPNP